MADRTMLGQSQAAQDLERDIKRVIEREPDILLDVPLWYLSTAGLAEKLVELGWRKA